MAFYQKRSKDFLLGPVGVGAVATSTSIVLSRFTSSTPSPKVNQIACTKINAIARSHFGALQNHCIGTFSRVGCGQQHQRFFASSRSKEATAKKGKGFVEWYEGHLNSRPVTTKAITGSILWGIGDVIGQVVPRMIQDDSSSNKVEGSSPRKDFNYDYTRTARAVAFGFAIHAPLSHVHFNFLELMTVRAGIQGLSIPVFKTIMEQFVYWSWFSNSLYHGAMGAMQGMSPSQIYDRIADVLWDTQVAQWSFWIPVQLLNFRFVPVRHQLNVVLLTSVVWTALLSAWFPPEEKKIDEKESS